jgi:hypothetical protein
MRWAAWLPAVASFAGEAGQSPGRRWAGGWRSAHILHVAALRLLHGPKKPIFLGSRKLLER